MARLRPGGRPPVKAMPLLPAEPAARRPTPQSGSVVEPSAARETGQNGLRQPEPCTYPLGPVEFPLTSVLLNVRSPIIAPQLLPSCLGGVDQADRPFGEMGTYDGITLRYSAWTFQILNI